MKYSIASVVAITSLALSTPLFAGDAAAGKEISSSCVSCHGLNGRSTNPNYPNLAGQKKNYLLKAMKQYRDGTRKDAMMGSIVGKLSDDDLANLAEYYSSVGKK